jgi:hypothetical protein
MLSDFNHFFSGFLSCSAGRWRAEIFGETKSEFIEKTLSVFWTR